MPSGVYKREPIWIARMKLTKAKNAIVIRERKLAEAISYKNQCAQELKQLETTKNSIN